MPVPHNRFRLTLLAAALATTPLLAPASFAQSAAQAQSAVPLGRALATFAGQRGVALSFDPALAAGRQAPLVPDDLDTDAGFAALLQNSGLIAVRRTDGSYTLQRSAPTGSNGRQLRPLRVGGTSNGASLPYGQGITLDAAALQAQTKGNSDIATALRGNPAVQFSTTTSSARNGGEIRPGDISINGAPFYQNLFLLDGASINNDLDPADGINQAGMQANAVDQVPSAGQGIAVDVDLLESLTVHDANVPAAYGGFMGGVVDARSRAAGDSLSGKVWMRMARSAWDQLIANPAQELTYEQSATYAYQPEYDKLKLGARLEGRLANGLGIIGSVTRSRSEIPLRAYTAGRSSPGSDASRKTQTRENTAASVALDWTSESGIQLGANLSWAPTDDTYFIANTANSAFDIKSGGPVVSLRAMVPGEAWTTRHTVNYSDLETSRRSDEDYYKMWARSEAFDWGINNNSNEGSWGNIDQHDRKLGYRFVADREGFDLGATRHRLQAGAGVQRREANYKRLNDHYNFQDPYRTTSCTLADGSIDSDSCSLSPVFTTTNAGMAAGQGQYFRTLFLFHAGEFDVSGTDSEAWLQDDIQYRNFSFRPGLRVDHSSLWGSPTVAPRLAASWDVDGRGDTVVNAGVNRYYGRNFFNYLLREGREALREQLVRTSSTTEWDTLEGTRGVTVNRIRDIDMPYTNEWTLGVDQQWAGLQFNLKVVDRRTRRDVVRRLITDPLDSTIYNRNTYEYVNSGRSDARTWSLSISQQQPLEWAGTRTHWQLAADHTDVQRNYSSYEYSSDSLERIYYQGRVIHRYELPATDYVRPWSARLSTRTEVPALGLSWSNFLRIRAGFQGTTANGRQVVDGVSYPVLDRVVYPSGWSWDATLEYRLPLPREQEAYARLEVQNVLNRSNRTSGTTPGATYYEPGRSFWLELGYTF